MGTLVNRRRMMRGGEQPYIPASEYVQDGLVFQLDGIEYGNVAGQWTEIKSNANFVGNVDRASDGLGFRFIENVMIASSNPTIPTSATGVGIEIVIKDIVDVDTYDAISILSDKQSGTGVYIRLYKVRPSYNLYFGVNIGQKRFYLNDRSMSNGAILYADSNKCYFNGAAMTTYTTRADGYGAGSDIRIGNLSRSYTLYAIRMYNRQLTEEEVLYNQAIDSKRFKIHI